MTLEMMTWQRRVGVAQARARIYGRDSIAVETPCLFPPALSDIRGSMPEVAIPRIADSGKNMVSRHAQTAPAMPAAAGQLAGGDAAPTGAGRARPNNQTPAKKIPSNAPWRLPWLQPYVHVETFGADLFDQRVQSVDRPLQPVRHIQQGVVQARIIHEAPGSAMAGGDGGGDGIDMA